jgi:hypothetical protein
MLPTFRRFTISDYANAPDWAAQMFNPLNIFCEQTVTTLNKNLQFGQNVQGQKFSTRFTTDSGGSNPVITFAYTGGGQPNCCFIGKLEREDGVLIAQPYSIGKWYLNINTNPYQVTIERIVGLVSTCTYNVTFVVL